ncbi:MAG: hypothetical protein HY023_12755, partial [Chloroflexi bacterium]|nr:hypothetical protein [Chloroflexota bacterium]
GAYWFLPFWATVGLLPTALSEYAPQFGRAIGATPPLAIVVALGMWSVATLPGSFSRSRRLRTGEGWGVRALVIGLAFAASTGWAFRDYFFVWARSPQLFIAFDVGLRAIGEYASQLPTDEPVYLSPVPGDLYTLSFFMGDDTTRLRSFNGRRCLVFPARTQAPTHMIVVVRPGEDDRSLGRLAHLFPAGQPVWRANDREAPYAVDFRIPTGETASVAPGRPFRADFGHQVELLGYDLSADSIRPGETLTVSLLLKSQSPMTTDYTGFVHLTGPYSVGTRRRLWAQRDARPCDNSYLTTRWQAGEIVWDDSSLTLPVGAPPGDYRLRIGMYNLATGARLPVTAAGNTVSDDSLTLTRVVVKE